MSLPITFIFKSKKEVSLSEVFALFNCSSAGYISGIYFSNSGLSMVNISSRYRGIIKHVYEVMAFGFFKVRHKVPLITI